MKFGQRVEELGVVKRVNLGPRPIKDVAGGGGGIAKLRAGEETGTYGGEAVWRRGASLVTKLLRPCL